MSEFCGICKHWSSPELEKGEGLSGMWGECRRYAPAPSMDLFMSRAMWPSGDEEENEPLPSDVPKCWATPIWPVTADTMSCGDFVKMQKRRPTRAAPK